MEWRCPGLFPPRIRTVDGRAFQSLVVLPVSAGGDSLAPARVGRRADRAGSPPPASDAVGARRTVGATKKTGGANPLSACRGRTALLFAMVLHSDEPADSSAVAGFPYRPPCLRRCCHPLGTRDEDDSAMGCCGRIHRGAGARDPCPVWAQPPSLPRGRRIPRRVHAPERVLLRRGSLGQRPSAPLGPRRKPGEGPQLPSRRPLRTSHSCVSSPG